MDLEFNKMSLFLNQSLFYCIFMIAAKNDDKSNSVILLFKR